MKETPHSPSTPCIISSIVMEASGGKRRAKRLSTKPKMVPYKKKKLKTRKKEMMGSAVAERQS